MRRILTALSALVIAVPLAAQTDTTAHATFHIVPRRPVDALRAEALALTPPPGLGGNRSSDLVELVSLDATIKLDVRYATTNNFMSAPMYSQARAFLQRPAAEALVRAHRALARQGYGLLIHDAYRPWYVTWMFWQATPDSQHTFVADPATGSRHNRGAAVDLTLYDLKSGRAVRMPSGYDEFSVRAYSAYPGGTESERARRAMLRRFMEAEGFTVNPEEWWHFDYNGWRDYPVQNIPFERIH
jgi:D-alanyl-D-alanine dipeptidase